jgi:hypothetical protein
MNGLRGRGMKFVEPATPITSPPAPKLAESLASRKLLAMLRNTWQKWPKAKMLRRAEGFGVALDEDTSLYVWCSGNLTATEKRDLLALFATWLVVDPSGLMKCPTPRNG